MVTTAQLAAWVDRFAALVADNKSHLTELDSAIGDADHGANMSRGMSAASEQIKDLTEGPADALCKKVGMTLVSSVGGASGPLYGTFFMKFGGQAGTVDQLDGQQLAAALRAGLDGVVARGKAAPGDKTMIDAMAPAVDAFDAALGEGASEAEAAQRAADAAAQGRDKTVEMVAHKGRASYLGERSRGHADPGATSTALLFQALGEALARD